MPSGKNNLRFTELDLKDNFLESWREVFINPQGKKKAETSIQ
jgi:hypothetical protein